MTEQEPVSLSVFYNKCLLLEIFRYLRLTEIFRFGIINKRLDSIVDDLTGYKEHIKSPDTGISKICVERYFRWLYTNGKLKIAKTLHSIKKLNFEIGSDPLETACIANQQEMTKWLLDINCPINNDFCLYELCEGGDAYINTIKLLIEHGIDIHKSEEIALSNACKHGKDNIVELLLKNGADIHVKNERALRSACRNGKFKTVQLLIKYGADIHILNGAIILRAVRERNYRIVKLLIDLNLEIIHHINHALRMAVKVNSLKITKLLLSKGADANTNVYDRQDRRDWATGEPSLLRISCEHNNIALTRTLIAHGADINQYYGTALIYCCKVGYFALVKLLINSGADYRLYCDAAFRTLCRHGHLKIAEYFCRLCSDYKIGKVSSVEPLICHK